MSVGDKTLKKRDLKPLKMRETSSPAKVYQSRASKPSGVEKLEAAAAAGTDAALIDALNAKVDELIDALKK